MSELCLLDLLPPELVLEIVGHLNLDELARFSQASRSTYALVTESEQAIYRTAGYRLGLTNPQSAGSTAALVAPPAPTGAHRRQDELGSVVKRQQSISAHYDRVQNWKDFGQCSTWLNVEAVSGLTVAVGTLRSPPSARCTAWVAKSEASQYGHQV